MKLQTRGGFSRNGEVRFTLVKSTNKAKENQVCDSKALGLKK